MRMPPLPADFIHARACKLKCEKILTRPNLDTTKNLDTTYMYYDMQKVFVVNLDFLAVRAAINIRLPLLF